MYCGAGRWLGAQGTRGARRRGAGHAGGTLGAQAGRWARRRQARARQASRWARGRARGRQARGRARGRQARGQQSVACEARGACAAGARQARGLGAGPVAWERGLALGSALSALGPFSIRFDSFFFPESLNEHCSL